MSYCVNCGVELSEELRSCPLCQTPVYHPEKEKNAEEAVPVFPVSGERWMWSEMTWRFCFPLC